VASPSRLAALRPVRGAVALCLGAALLAGALALPLSELLSFAGRWSVALAAALAMGLAALPLALMLLKLARQVERQRLQLARLDAAHARAALPSRAQFVALAEREWARARRYGAGAAVLVVDVDRYRRLANARGTAAAEALLGQMATHTASTLRGGDALAHYGDGQLAVFLAQADPTGALDAAERIRERLEQLEVSWPGQPLRATVSVGVATLRPAHQSLTALLDEALLGAAAAGQAGGNCVRLAPFDSGRLQAPGSSVDDNQAAGPF
jgi:diguanylate cyclase (GGDEF)-like protein